MPLSSDEVAGTRVLLVDDEPQVRRSLGRLLSAQGWTVEEAASGSEALDRITSFGPELMLLDVKMPGMSGVEVVSSAISLDPDLGILMLTAVKDAASATVCLQRGAADYLTKPIEAATLESALRRALKRRSTMLENQGNAEQLKNAVTRSTQALERERLRLHELQVATLATLINTLEAKNTFLAGHSARVAACAAAIASEMGLDDDEVERIRLAGRLHDLGMIGVRERVLNKEGKLTDEEYEHVKRHVTIGAEILEPLKHLGDVVSYVRTHHEFWNGGGYPQGLAGNDIPLGGRILCASEIYDALTSKRPYQESFEADAALERMRGLSGRVLDPAVVEAVTQTMSRGQQLVFIADAVQGMQEDPTLYS